MIEVTAGI